MVAYGVPAGCITASGAYGDFFNGRSTALAELLQPSQTMMIGEKYGGNPQYILSTEYYVMRASHNDGSNIAFCDGHAKWTMMEDGPIGAPWADPHGSPYSSLHPPREFISNVRK